MDSSPVVKSGNMTNLNSFSDLLSKVVSSSNSSPVSRLSRKRKSTSPATPSPHSPALQNSETVETAVNAGQVPDITPPLNTAMDKLCEKGSQELTLLDTETSEDTGEVPDITPPLKAATDKLGEKGSQEVGLFDSKIGKENLAPNAHVENENLATIVTKKKVIPSPGEKGYLEYRSEQLERREKKISAQRISEQKLLSAKGASVKSDEQVSAAAALLSGLSNRGTGSIIHTSKNPLKSNNDLTRNFCQSAPGERMPSKNTIPGSCPLFSEPKKQLLRPSNTNSCIMVSTSPSIPFQSDKTGMKTVTDRKVDEEMESESSQEEILDVNDPDYLPHEQRQPANKKLKLPFKAIKVFTPGSGPTPEPKRKSPHSAPPHPKRVGGKKRPLPANPRDWNVQNDDGLKITPDDPAYRDKFNARGKHKPSTSKSMLQEWKRFLSFLSTTYSHMYGPQWVSVLLDGKQDEEHIALALSDYLENRININVYQKTGTIESLDITTMEKVWSYLSTQLKLILNVTVAGNPKFDMSRQTKNTYTREARSLGYGNLAHQKKDIGVAAVEVILHSGVLHMNQPFPLIGLFFVLVTITFNPRIRTEMYNMRRGDLADPSIQRFVFLFHNFKNYSDNPC